MTREEAMEQITREQGDGMEREEEGGQGLEEELVGGEPLSPGEVKLPLAKVGRGKWGGGGICPKIFDDHCHF